MIRATIPSVLCVLLLTAPGARAIEVAGDQSGVWTLAESPYELVGDVRVPPGATLTIEPGVTVIAQGYWKFLVDQSTLFAVGSESNPILFTALNTEIGWRGITFDSAQDESTISYCIIEHAHRTGSASEVAGGAIYCLYSSPAIMHSELRFNSAHNEDFNGIGGGIATLYGSPIIKSNFIHDNSADGGGGVYCGGYGTPYVTDNIVQNNSSRNRSGGVAVTIRSTGVVERNLIVGNVADGEGGGGMTLWYWYARDGLVATVRDNVIVGNTSAYHGGGVYCNYDKTVLTNNLIAFNSAPNGGGVYALNDGVFWPSFENCILWGNTSNQPPHQVYLHGPTGSRITVRWSDVQGGFPDFGNINADPLLVDPAGGDYHLREDSPCIDAGKPSFVPAEGETDIDGEPRVVGGRVDMGADEFLRGGDFDCDGDVDLVDFALFAQCFGGSNNPPAGGCPGIDSDLDDDGDVDLTDFAIFAQNFTGSQ